MASGKNTRPDGRRSSSFFCSAATTAVFVAVCLVALWMLTSSDVIPLYGSPAKSGVDAEDAAEDLTSLDVVGGGGMNDAEEERTVNDQILESREANSAKESGDDEPKTQADQEQRSEKENESGGEQEQSETRSKAAEGELSEGLQEETAAEDQKQDTDADQTPSDKKADDGQDEEKTVEAFPDGASSEIPKETSAQNGAWSTQAVESKNEKEAQMSARGQAAKIRWELCKTAAGPDYIPCLDNQEAIRKLPSTAHYEHRERHCPDEGPTCLVPLPEGYRRPIRWPESRDKIWYFNVPHSKLAELKGHQNWVKVSGEYLTFPGGGTQFKHGALHYIDFIQETLPEINWGKRSRVVLDVGCGVASFGGFLFERDVLAMSFAPKDEHEAQVQLALERGIPAISAVMGTRRLPFPGGIFDVVHCARCRVPWHIEGGKLLLELNRLLRPGGYFVWSATPTYQSLPEDAEIWRAMSKLTKSMCWKMMKIKNDTVNGVGVAIYRKPSSNECYEKRREDDPPLCQDSDDPDAAWNVPLEACMHRVSVDPAKRGSKWPGQWRERAAAAPYWLDSSQVGVYGKPAPADFGADFEHWKHVVGKSYLKAMGIDWSNVRNVMDMRSIYGGFAAALREMKIWVMNVVPIDSPDTLPIIYERGLFGIYHDWCESFSTYPRSYDLLHADHLFSNSKLNKRCKLPVVMAEVDRILRPEGSLIVRDDVETIGEVQDMAKSLHWKVQLAYTKENEGLLCVQKTMWRPQEAAAAAGGSQAAA